MASSDPEFFCKYNSTKMKGCMLRQDAGKPSEYMKNSNESNNARIEQKADLKSSELNIFCKHSEVVRASFIKMSRELSP